LASVQSEGGKDEVLNLKNYIEGNYLYRKEIHDYINDHIEKSIERNTWRIMWIRLNNRVNLYGD